MEASYKEAKAASEADTKSIENEMAAVEKKIASAGLMELNTIIDRLNHIELSYLRELELGPDEISRLDA